MSQGENREGSASKAASSGVYQFAYARSRDQDAAEPVRHPIVIVGAGPVGLSLAIDLAQRGRKVVLLDDADRIGEGSRAICFSKRSLEVWDRLGVGDRMLAKGVEWKVGKVFLGDGLVYGFDLLPEDGNKRPAFINLQQFYAEKYLVERVAQLPAIDLRWRNKVTGLDRGNDGVTITVETPEGSYRLGAHYLVACDGARSQLRALVGAEFVGETFEDQFLIADVKMQAEFPTERWFWFDTPFHSGQSALLHRQPDDVWRIDLQLGPDADPKEETRPERVRPRIERMLGHGDFTFEWISLYRFQCRRMKRFLHGRVIFAGDSAHQVSPFGARGANSGLEDGENLAWKLDLVLGGKADDALLESYDLERTQAADDNIGHSTRSTDFIAPHSAFERQLRNTTLRLAGKAEFAKRMVNAGRLSTPTVYDTPLSTPDTEAWSGRARPGTAMIDARLEDANGQAHFLTELFHRAGCRFTLLTYGVADAETLAPDLDLARIAIGPRGYTDTTGAFAERWGAEPGSAYLLRPDGYVAARIKAPTPARVAAAHRRACACA